MVRQGLNGLPGSSGSGSSPSYTMVPLQTWRASSASASVIPARVTIATVVSSGWTDDRSAGDRGLFPGPSVRRYAVSTLSVFSLTKNDTGGGPTLRAGQVITSR